MKNPPPVLADDLEEELANMLIKGGSQGESEEPAQLASPRSAKRPPNPLGSVLSGSLAAHEAGFEGDDGTSRSGPGAKRPRLHGLQPVPFSGGSRSRGSRSPLFSACRAPTAGASSSKGASPCTVPDVSASPVVTRRFRSEPPREGASAAGGRGALRGRRRVDARGGDGDGAGGGADALLPSDLDEAPLSPSPPPPARTRARRPRRKRCRASPRAFHRRRCSRNGRARSGGAMMEPFVAISSSYRSAAGDAAFAERSCRPSRRGHEDSDAPFDAALLAASPSPVAASCGSPFAASGGSPFAASPAAGSGACSGGTSPVSSSCLQRALTLGAPLSQQQAQTPPSQLAAGHRALAASIGAERPRLPSRRPTLNSESSYTPEFTAPPWADPPCRRALLWQSRRRWWARARRRRARRRQRRRRSMRSHRSRH